MKERISAHILRPRARRRAATYNITITRIQTNFCMSLSCKCFLRCWPQPSSASAMLADPLRSLYNFEAREREEEKNKESTVMLCSLLWPAGESYSIVENYINNIE